MDIEVGTFEAKNRLSELLTQVEKGQRIYITRRGKRIALLTSATDADSHCAKTGKVADQFRALRRAANAGPESLRDLIEEGRR